MNLDWAFSKTYDARNYNCAHFVIEIFEKALGIDGPMKEALEGFLTGRGDRRVYAHKLKVFKRLDQAREGCLCLFHAPASEPHVGIYLEGRVLHLTKTGVHWVELPIAMIGFKRAGFYELETGCNS